MLNFFRSVLLAAIATIPIYAVTVPIQLELTTLFFDLRDGNGFSVDLAEWMTAIQLLSLVGLTGIAAAYSLVVGSFGAILVDKFFMPNGGSKKQYARIFAIVGLIGSGLVAFVFAVPAFIAGYVAGWVYGANRKLKKNAPLGDL